MANKGVLLIGGVGILIFIIGVFQFGPCLDGSSGQFTEACIRSIVIMVIGVLIAMLGGIGSLR